MRLQIRTFFHVNGTLSILHVHILSTERGFERDVGFGQVKKRRDLYIDNKSL